MDWVTIAQVAIATVSLTEVLKNFINYGGKKFWTFMTLVVGAGVGVMEYFLPEKVVVIITGVSIAIIFYDTIFKYIQKRIKKLGED